MLKHTLLLYGLFLSVACLAQTNKDFFSLILLPDTENYSVHYPQIADSQTEWIASNVDNLNIKFVLHLGDITDNCQTPEWQTMQTVMRKLDGVVPYSLCVGNHDYDFPPVIEQRSTKVFNSYFPHTSAPSTLQGFYQPGVMDNCYHIFTVGHTEYLHLVLEFGPRTQVLTWADEILSQFPHHKVIISTHCYMNWDNTRVSQRDRFNPYEYAKDVNDGEDMWNKLIKKHDNVFLVVSGHMLTSGGLGKLVSLNDAGHNVYQLLVDYQGYDFGGNGYLRILKFYPNDKKIEAISYSPWLDKYFTDAKNQFTFANATEAFSVKQPPTFIEELSLTSLEDTPLQISHNFLRSKVTDLNHTAEQLTFEIASSLYIQINQSPTQFNGTIIQDWFGNDSLQCIVTDPTGLADTTQVHIKILPVNDPPIILDLPDLSFAEDQPHEIDFGPFLWDKDNAKNELAVSIQVTDFQPGSANADTSDLHYTYQPSTQKLRLSASANVYGEFTTIIKTTDPDGASASQPCNITVQAVNDPPQLSALPPLTMHEDDSLRMHISTWQTLVQDDAPISEIQWHVQNSAHIFCRQADGEITLIPENNWFGDDSILVIVNDHDMLAASTYLHITVNPVNDPPIISSLPDISFNEDENALLNLQPYIRDIDNELAELTLDVRLLQYTPNPLQTLHIAGMQDLLISLDGMTAKFESTTDSCGIFQVEFSVQDPAHASSVDTINVTIVPLNDAPQISTLLPLTWAEDDSLVLVRDCYYAFVHDAETAPEQLTFSLESDSCVQINQQVNGWVLRAGRDWFGKDSLRVKVKDTLGAETIAAQKIIITPVNDAPVWQSMPPINLIEEIPLQLDLDEFVSDIDNANDELFISATVSDSSHLAMHIDAATHVLILQGNAEIADTLSMFFLARDPQGLTAKNVCKIFLQPINDAPVIASIPAIKMDEDTELSFSINAWQPFVHDADHTFNELGWKLSSSSHISAQLNHTIVRVHPQEDWFGEETIFVIVNDPIGAQDSTQIKIVVQSVNDLPTIENLPDSLHVGTTAEKINLWQHIHDVETAQADLQVMLSSQATALFSYYEKSNGELVLVSTSNEAYETWLKIRVTDAQQAVAEDSIFIRRWPTNVSEQTQTVQQLALQPCYPNPFNGITTITYTLPAQAPIHLYVLNILGKEIAVLENDLQEAGAYTFVWNAVGLPSGAYFVVLQTPQERLVQRCLLVN